MNTPIQHRSLMALIGAAAGVSLYALGEILDGDLLGERLTLALAAFTAVFFFGLLGMAGPVSLLRAAAAALAVATGVAVLLSLAALRFASIDGLANSPIPGTAAFILASLPLPFLIAGFGPGWRDYPALFAGAWGVVVRYGVAWVFVAVVWGVILLSDALFGIVGLTLIEDLLKVDPVPWLITGTVLGLALAVVAEMSEVVTPYLILRLLRLLVPVVLAVLVVFVVALPVRGLSGLLGGLSVAATLMGMAAAAAVLVTSALDDEDASAPASAPMRRATQALALVLPVPAALGAWAVWLRVDQYGWTPDRLFAATVGVMGLAYGVIYALAVLRGPGWMARIRSGNTALALVLIGVAALWLTVLNPEAISARNQVARLADGRTPVAQLDLYALDRWGRAGAAARVQLEALAAQPGQDALGQRLADPEPAPTQPAGPDLAPLRSALAAVMPLQPRSATAIRDGLLDAATADELQGWTDVCAQSLDTGEPGCVMVVADLLPASPGEEAMLILRDAANGYMRFEGLFVMDGLLQYRAVWSSTGTMPDLDEGATLIARLQQTPPAVSPAALNQFSSGPGDAGLALSP